MSEQQFTISVPQSALDTLSQKLELATLPSAAPQSDDERDYGVPLNDIERLVERWKHGYDWRTAESELNASMPQFTRPIEVDGFGVLTAHYVHMKSTRADAIPLLFLHGCQCMLAICCGLLTRNVRAWSFYGGAQTATALDRPEGRGSPRLSCCRSQPTRLWIFVCTH